MSEVWVKCEICDKGFDSYEALIAHIYSHIDELKQKLQKSIKLGIESENELLELKQKLQQLLDEFPKSEFATMGNLKQISTTFKGEEVQNWKKKFEELLKEADKE
jgi:hypothetical protein